jgi:peptidoglycan hydrolase-like protein with peptidoglycan-binding domain
VKRLLGVALTTFALLISAGVVATPASAVILNTYPWDAGPEVGSCGEQTGGFVAAVEFYLSATGAYSGEFDSEYGPLLEAAITTYKSNHGLTADACVGSGMWFDMQSQLIDEGQVNPCTGNGGAGSTAENWWYLHNNRLAVYFERNSNETWFSNFDRPLSVDAVSPLSYNPYRFSTELWDYNVQICGFFNT